MVKNKIWSDYINIEDRKIIVESATPENTQWLGYDWYSTDGNNVICDERETTILEKADPYTFHLFPKVKVRVIQKYYNHNINRVTEDMTNEILQSYAIDSERVYYNQRLLNGINAKSFHRLGTQGYAMDSKHLLFTNRIIGLTPKGKIKHYGLVLQTENEVYVAGNIIKKIDSNTFKRINKNGIFQDKNSKYQLQCEYLSKNLEDIKLVPIT